MLIARKLMSILKRGNKMKYSVLILGIALLSGPILAHDSCKDPYGNYNNISIECDRQYLEDVWAKGKDLVYMPTYKIDRVAKLLYEATSLSPLLQKQRIDSIMKANLEVDFDYPKDSPYYIK